MLPRHLALVLLSVLIKKKGGKMRNFVLMLCLLLMTTGCGMSKYFGGEDASIEDKIEVGLYKSILSSEKTYHGLVDFAALNRHLFSEEQIDNINSIGDKYTQALLAALKSWRTYKLYGNSEDLSDFISSANDALREFRELHILIKGEEA
jgi:hypothetical protein